MKPLIAVVSLYDETKESYWMLPGYAQALEQAGAAPVLLPLTKDPALIRQYATAFDGFLFPGGHDLIPELYGETQTELCGVFCPQRDEMEPLLLKEAMKQRKPLFGICRGIQLFNAVLGGTLYQDLPTQFPSEINHHETPPYDKKAHTVTVKRSSPLYEILRKDAIPVNSYHHQAILRLGEGLAAAAQAEDGIIEAVYLKDYPYGLAVQWHPEFSYLSDENSRTLFRSFVRAAEKK